MKKLIRISETQKKGAKNGSVYIQSCMMPFQLSPVEDLTSAIIP